MLSHMELLETFFMNYELKSGADTVALKEGARKPNAYTIFVKFTVHSNYTVIERHCFGCN